MENFQSVGISLWILAPFWIMVALFAIAVAGGLIQYFFFEPEWPIPGVAAAFGAVFGVIAALFWIISLIPFDAKYHHIYRVEGEVKSVSNVLSESSGELTRTPVLTVEGIDRDITMNDPRAVNLEGKTVTFTCSVAWNYEAADSYGCDIYSIAR